MTKGVVDNGTPSSGFHEDQVSQLAKARITFEFDEGSFKRRVSGKEVIVHCHHYNARMQGTVESVTMIDGKEIIRSSAAKVFFEHITDLFHPEDTDDFKWKLVEYLYAYLGYGTIDCSHADEWYITSGSSHFVEGWLTGFEKPTCPVCTFTEGFIQGAYFAITGKSVQVNEVHCMVSGSGQCRFEVSFSEKLPVWNERIHYSTVSNDHENVFLKSPNIQEERIITAMKNMPLQGNSGGLIPVFNVYLANIPADFYNLVSIRFIEEMEKLQMGEAARKLLTCCGEICALHTFRGVMHSAEWDGLIAPMIREPRDRLFALVTITNGLGWGNWQVQKFIEDEHLEMISLNGYESSGFRSLRGQTMDPKCYMLAGVSAGLMELLYSEGSLDDKFGTFISRETECMCCGSASCKFEVTRALPEY